MSFVAVKGAWPHGVRCRWRGVGLFLARVFSTPRNTLKKWWVVCGLSRSWRGQPVSPNPLPGKAFGLPQTKMDNSVAEREGFEPSIQV